jgi:hypothetical protein
MFVLLFDFGFIQETKSGMLVTARLTIKSNLFYVFSAPTVLLLHFFSKASTTP